jgi:hypothetical protein
VGVVFPHKGNKCEDPSPVGCIALFLGKWFLVLKRFVVPSSPKVNQFRDTKCVWEVGAKRYIWSFKGG